MRILIVGGGIAGLLKGYYLSRQNHDIVIIEKTPFLGGELRTLRYNFNGDTYLFDLGPHIPPKNNKIWNTLCKKIEIINLPSSLRVSLKLEKLELIYPLSLKKIYSTIIFCLFKLGPFFLYSVIRKKKEKNFEDSLINSWGATFYKNVLKAYFIKFWKVPPNDISKKYIARIPPPKIKFFLQKFLDSSILHSPKPTNKQIKKLTTSSIGFFPYPIYGIEGVINPLVNELNRSGQNIKRNATIKKIIFKNDSLYAEIKDQNGVYINIFDKVIWAASISDLVRLLGLHRYKKFQYLHLLTINCVVFKKKLLRENIHTSYIMIPNIMFHRIYEPNKLSPFMSPKSTTSVCIELTIKKKPQNMELLIKKCLKQFCRIFSLSESQIKYLGYHIIENVYPFLFTNYQSYLDKLQNELKENFKNVTLIGRLGQYYPYNLRKTLKSIGNI